MTKEEESIFILVSSRKWKLNIKHLIVGSTFTNLHGQYFMNEGNMNLTFVVIIMQNWHIIKIKYLDNPT